MCTVSAWSLLSRALPLNEVFSFSRLVQTHRFLSNTPITMAVKANLSHKALESPFSHLEMYGRKHPASSKVVSTGGGRQKVAKSKSKGFRGGSNKQKQSSAKSFGSVSTYSTRSSTSSSTSPSRYCKKKGTKTSIKITKQTGNAIVRNGNVTSAKTSSTSEGRSCGLIQVDHDSPVLIAGGMGQTSQLHQRNGAWNNSKSSLSRSASKISSLDCSAASKVLSSTCSSAVSSGKSLLARSSSSMSTSEVLLSFNKDLRKSGNIDCSANVRLGSKTVKNANLPPHVHLPRRGFVDSESRPTSGTRRMFSGSPKGTAKSGALTIDDIGMGLGKMQYRNVIVMSGAGVSTTSGIPDFRTPGTGLYDNLQQYKIPDATAIFDISFFVHNPKPFLTLAKELYPGRYQPNTVHYFVKLLQEKGLLLRNYTQNIDGLERLAGVKPGKLVEAHGSFSTASCIICKTKQDPDEVKAKIFSGQTPRCKYKFCYGLVKPDIVFFGEDLPQRFHSLQLPDFAKCDLLIIMGTSLEVEPFASLTALPQITVPRLLINRELVGPFNHRRKRSTDVAMTGDLVECVSKLVAMAGWEKDLETIVKGVDSDSSSESVVPPSASLELQSVSSSSDSSPTPNNSSCREMETGRDDTISEEEITSSMSALSLLEEKPRSSSKETDTVGVGGRGGSDTKKEQGHKRNERTSAYGLREKRSELTVISEGDEELDEEGRDWNIGDVFAGLDKDSTDKK